MGGKSQVGAEEEKAVPRGELDGVKTLEDELSNELAVLHRVFRHNFRNRLNLVMGHAKLAKEHAEDESLDEYLDKILDEANRLVMTVDQVSLIQRLASSDACPNVVDIVPTLEEIIAEFDEQTATSFEFSSPESVWVWMNPKYKNAFRELIENAIVHNTSPDPQITVQVNEERTTEVIIADNGPGMPSGIKASLETQDVDPTTHLTSLGLWTAYWIITRSGGALSIDDNKPRGCQITVSLRSASPSET